MNELGNFVIWVWGFVFGFGIGVFKGRQSVVRDAQILVAEAIIKIREGYKV